MTDELQCINVNIRMHHQLSASLTPFLQNLLVVNVNLSCSICKSKTHSSCQRWLITFVIYVCPVFPVYFAFSNFDQIPTHPHIKYRHSSCVRIEMLSASGESLTDKSERFFSACESEWCLFDESLTDNLVEWWLFCPWLLSSSHRQLCSQLDWKYQDIDPSPQISFQSLLVHATAACYLRFFLS